MDVSGLPKGFQLALADRYVIDREIGYGASATVWLANDVRHQRTVAIKVLRPELSATLGHDRFLNEIRIAAALQHPHILTLIDSGSAAGLLYFVMPFVDDDTLSQRLARAGRLGQEEVLSLATDVGGALEHAHRRGIVHRDVKPANILIREGVGIVADFGIGIAVGEVSSDRLTQTGLVVGTPEYMSPEQALGEEVDARSDLYSLACTLFEALAGDPPFHGATRKTLLARHISLPAPELRHLRPELPRHLSDALRKALAKEPKNRFASVQEFVSELHEGPSTSSGGYWRRLREWIPGLQPKNGTAEKASTPRTPRVAVLPFLDISREGESAYVCQGVTEEIISAIWKSHRIDVISRTSAFQYRDSDQPPEQIARELGVTHLVEGSVQTAADEYRITVRLVEGSTGEGIANEVFPASRDDKDLLQVQYEIARWVVGALGEGPVSGERDTEHRGIVRAELALYRGRDAWNRRSFDGFREARRAFSECLKADPTHPKGNAAMADLYNLLGAFDYAYMAPKQAYPLALHYARNALEQGSSLAEAHAAMANALLSFEWDGVAAAESLERAIRLNPGYSPARQWYSTLLMMEGRAGEAEIEAYRALEFDPKSPSIWANIGRVLQFRRLFGQAAEKFEVALSQARAFPPAHIGLALAQAQGGNPSGALAMLDGLRAATAADFPLLDSLRGYVLALAGKEEEALEEASKLEARYFDHPANAATDLSATQRDSDLPYQRYPSAEYVAAVHIGLGNHETAIDWLERARDNRSQVIIFLGIDPFFDPLRSNPRFQALAGSVRLRS